MVVCDPMESHLTLLTFEPSGTPSAESEKVGFRLGAKGTHTSRTVMLVELETALDTADESADWNDYKAAIVEDNCLSKPTAATRRLSAQRLSELYGLDPRLPLFRVLRRLWAVDPVGRPRLALLAAVARDPLLAATAPAVIPLPPGTEFQRALMRSALRDAVGERLNDAVLEKTCRNAASSWTQSGHLDGRTFKTRRLVPASPAVAAFALYLAHAAGFRGNRLFSSAWFRLIDCTPPKARRLALDAKRLGLIDLRVAGDVVALDIARLDPAGGV